MCSYYLKKTSLFLCMLCNSISKLSETSYKMAVTVNFQFALVQWCSRQLKPEHIHYLCFHSVDSSVGACAFFVRGHLIHAVFGEGGTWLEDWDHGRRQSDDGGRASAAAQRKQVHLEEGVPINHGEVSKCLCYWSTKRAQVKKILRASFIQVSPTM